MFQSCAQVKEKVKILFKKITSYCKNRLRWHRTLFMWLVVERLTHTLLKFSHILYRQVQAAIFSLTLVPICRLNLFSDGTSVLLWVHCESALHTSTTQIYAPSTLTPFYPAGVKSSHFTLRGWRGCKQCKQKTPMPLTGGCMTGLCVTAWLSVTRRCFASPRLTRCHQLTACQSFSTSLSPKDALAVRCHHDWLIWACGWGSTLAYSSLPRVCFFKLQ